MSFKRFLIGIYSLAGLFIASFSAFMTYLIIGEPIGMKMFSKIALTVILAMPVIALISYWVGSRFFAKFEIITKRLDALTNEDFTPVESDETIKELNHIHGSINQLAERLSGVITDLKHQNRTIANMSLSFAHDVKTPLMIIDGYLEELQDGLSDTATIVEKLRRESGYIDDLSSDLLEYLGSFQAKRDRENIVLKGYIEECISLISFRPEVRCIIDIPDDFSLLFNPMDFKKIVMNLLHNSAKFTSEGEVCISGIGESILFEDTGCGIDPAVLDRVFDPFVSADASKNRRSSGLGIGLSIAKNLAMNNGYDLRIDKNVSKGSRLILSKYENLTIL